MKIGNAVRNANSDSSINGNWTPKYCSEKKTKRCTSHTNSIANIMTINDERMTLISTLITFEFEMIRKRFLD